MNLSSINAELLNITRQGHLKGGEEMYEKIDLIDELCSDSRKIFTRLDLPEDHQDLDANFINKVYIATLFSDTVRLYSNSFVGTYKKTIDYNVKEMHELLKYYELIDKRARKPKLTVAEGFNTFTKQEADFLHKRLYPLFEAERLTLSPNLNFMVMVEKDDNFYTIPAEFDSNRKLRAPLFGYNQKDVPMSELRVEGKGNGILESILLPYLSGLPARDYAQVLLDESDLLSSFRRDLKNLMKTSNADNLNAEELYQDTVRPRVDKIQQKFKSISEIHAFKIKGVFAFTATLSLLSFATGDYLSAASMMIGVGSGSAGLVKFESEYQTEFANLKNDSMFLLWKLSKIKR